MSTFPQNPIGSPDSSKFPQSPGQTLQSHSPGRSQPRQQEQQSIPLPPQRPESPQGQIHRPPQNTELPARAMAPPRAGKVRCCGFPDIRTAIAIFGVIHMILQIVVCFRFRLDIKDRYDGHSYLDNDAEELSLQLDDLRKQVSYLSYEKGRNGEIRLAIVVYSALNSVVVLFFFCVMTKGGKVACSACYIIGLFLQFIIIALFCRILPGRSAQSDDASAIIHSSVVIALFYHVYGFVFISCGFCETKTEGPNTASDLESGLPLPAENSPTQSGGYPGVQQPRHYQPTASTTAPLLQSMK